MLKDIKGYEGLYSYIGNTIFQMVDGKILKPSLVDGELVIRLMKNRVSKIYKIKDLIK